MPAGYYDDVTTSDIIGARGGGDALSNVVKSILEQIMESKELINDSNNPDQILSDWGTDWVTGTKENAETPWWQGEGSSQASDYQFGLGYLSSSPHTNLQSPESNYSFQPGGAGYNLENLLMRLEGMYGEEGTHAESMGGHEHMKKFYNMLTDLDIGAKATGYHKDVSDISAEFGGQYSDLRNKLTGSTGKKGRYSSLTGGGKPKFSTDDYLSQWYGTKEKEQELYGTERKNVLSDYNDEMMKLLDTYS